MLATFAPGRPGFGYLPPKRDPIIVPNYPTMARLFNHNDQLPPRGSCPSSRRRRGQEPSICVMPMIIRFTLDYYVRFLSAVALNQPHTNHRAPSVSSPLLSSPLLSSPLLSQTKFGTALSLPFSRTESNQKQPTKHSCCMQYIISCTGVYSKQDQILPVKIGKYIPGTYHGSFFCVPYTW